MRPPQIYQEESVSSVHTNRRLEPQLDVRILHSQIAFRVLECELKEQS